MFGAKSREIARLNRLLDARTQQLSKTRVLVAIYSSRINALDRQSLGVRLDRAVRACAQYRRDLSVQHRVVDQLSEQLFDSLDYNPAARKLLDLPPLVAPEDAEPKL
jgi:hypothetical protein